MLSLESTILDTITAKERNNVALYGNSGRANFRTRPYFAHFNCFLSNTL
jgi:hypothetical protein